MSATVSFTLPTRTSRPPPPPRPRTAPRRGDRAARMLALAHVVEAAIEAGTIRDLADAARLLGVSRARMSQLAMLTTLAPDVQERVLCGHEFHERKLRAALRFVDWTQQRAALGIES